MSKRKKKQRIGEGNESQLLPGEKLRHTREARELSTADVAVRLKLSVEKIDALERGDVESVATPVFVAGYLRTYARLLDLSETEVLADFPELLQLQESITDPAFATGDENVKSAASEASRPSSSSSKLGGNSLAIAVFAGFFVLVLVYLLSPSDEIARKSVVEAPNSAAERVLLEPETNLVAEIEPPEVETTVMLAEEQHVVAELVVETVLNDDVTAEQVDEPEATTFEPVTAGMKSELMLSFNSDSWAEVKDARGQRLVYRLGKSGSTRIVTGVAPFMVQLGYVQGVDIFYNGTMFDLEKYANRRSVRLFIGEAGDSMSNE